MFRVKFFYGPILLLFVVGVFFLTQILLSRSSGEHLSNAEKEGNTEILRSNHFIDEETGLFDNEYTTTKPDRERLANPDFLRWDEHASDFQLPNIAGCWGCYGLYR